MIDLKLLKNHIVKYKDEFGVRPLVLVNSEYGGMIRGAKGLKTNRRYLGKVGGSRVYVDSKLDGEDYWVLLVDDKGGKI